MDERARALAEIARRSRVMAGDHSDDDLPRRTAEPGRDESAAASEETAAQIGYLEGRRPDQ